MKIEKNLKVILAIIIIILISLISFGGIYIQKMKFVENVIPEYKLGMDLEGGRLVTLEVDKSTNKTIYDKDGKVVTKEGKDTTTKEVPVNDKSILTEENYNQTKKIVEKRLNAMGVSDYTIRQNEKDGTLYVQIPEDENTDTIAQYMTIKGEFTVVNDDGEILLNDSHLEKTQVGYSNTENGTAVYLTIQLNKEGTRIFKDITNTYVATTDEDGKQTTKKITLKIDDSTLLSTYFTSEISNGTIQMSIGSATTDASEIEEYIQEASNIAVLLNTGKLPITYNISDNKYIMSDITEEMFYIPVAVIEAVILIGLIYIIVRYKKNGILAAVSFIGYIGALLLILRYANVVLTMEGMIAIVVSVIMNYIFTIYVLNLIKHEESKTKDETSKAFKEAFIKTLFIFIPVAIFSVVLCFAGWLPIYSFGMVAFWGLLLIVLYNLIITRTLLVNTNKK